VRLWPRPSSPSPSRATRRRARTPAAEKTDPSKGGCPKVVLEEDSSIAAERHPRVLTGAAAAGFALTFLSLAVLERPGLGLGHFFYVSIGLIALRFGPRLGAAAGALATGLYTLGVLINPSLPVLELLTISTPIRLVTYTATGLLIGWFAQRNRHLVERLEVLASRDRLTGLPNMRAFEAAVDRRFERGEPFAILLGDLDALREANEAAGHGEGDLVLVELAETLGRLVRPGEEIARVGGDEFAILASLRGKEAGAARANELERRLAESGLAVTFGWAAYPDEGANALGLIRVADERLYARKLVRGRRLDEPSHEPRPALAS
jgi:diguanylate cyclase (GGDEF)-like protein